MEKIRLFLTKYISNIPIISIAISSIFFYIILVFAVLHVFLDIIGFNTGQVFFGNLLDYSFDILLFEVFLSTILPYCLIPLLILFLLFSFWTFTKEPFFLMPNCIIGYNRNEYIDNKKAYYYGTLALLFIPFAIVMFYSIKYILLFFNSSFNIIDDDTILTSSIFGSIIITITFAVRLSMTFETLNNKIEEVEKLNETLNSKNKKIKKLKIKYKNKYHKLKEETGHE